jgi:hypothetical protein
VAITNLSPRQDGSVPVLADPSTPAGGGAPAPAPAPAPAGGASGGPPGGARSDAPPVVRASRTLVESPPTIPFSRDGRIGRDVGGSALDPWYWDLQGQGPGPMDPASEHAFSGLVGTLPTAILWQGFKGTYSPIAVVQTMLVPVWSSNLRLKITGEWDRIFEHFSAHAQARYYWFSADIKAEMNNLRISGGIKVELLIDGTAPGGDQLEKEINKRIELITDKFMEQAKQRIFEPAPPDVKPAEANSGGALGSLFSPYSAGFALKYRRDSTQLRLNYEETRKFRYNRLHVISSSLEGFFDEIKKDPDAERKYFQTLYLDDWDRKITRIVKPVVNWPDEGRKWVGEPVAFLSCQIGYPDTRGAIQWAPRVFQSTDTGDLTKWTPAFAKKNAADVVNPPAGWAPDKTFVKRRVHFTEPPGALDSPNDRVFVERNVVDLDDGENGTLSSDNTIEVRADSVGLLEVGPISLGVALDSATQVVEVEFQATGKTLNGEDRPVVRFTWKFSDQEDPRRWKIFTGDSKFVPQFKYRVRVVVKGSLFTKGMEWTTGWMEGGGNGPLTVSVPTPDDPGVTKKLDVESSTSTTPSPPPGPVAPLMPPPTGGNVRPASAPVSAPPGARSTVPPPASARGYDLADPTPVARSERTPPTSPPPVSTPPAARAEAPLGRLETVSGWSRDISG